jgi:hypothetical protein
MVDALIREHPRLVLAHVVDIVGISYGSAQAIVHDNMGLREQPKSFFFEGMKKLIERYQKCIIVQGN